MVIISDDFVAIAYFFIFVELYKSELNTKQCWCLYSHIFIVWSLSSLRVIGSWFREKRFKCSHNEPKMVDHIHAMIISCNGIKINMISVLKARSFVNQLYPPILEKFSGKQFSPLGKWKTFGNYQSFNIPPSTLGTDSSMCASGESARECCV